MEQRIENKTTNATYAKEIMRLMEQLPESPEAGKLLCRVWKLMLLFIYPDAYRS